MISEIKIDENFPSGPFKINGFNALFCIDCGCSPVNLLHIFRTPLTKNTSEWLLLSGW